MRKLTRPCIGPLSQRVNDLWCHWEKVVLVDNEPRAAHCLLALRHIEEMDWNANFRGIQTSGFGLSLSYDSKTGIVGHLCELIVKRIYSSVYPTVECEFRHERCVCRLENESSKGDVDHV